MKDHLKTQKQTTMQSARAWQKASILTKKLSLTETQVEKLVALIEKRGRNRLDQRKKFKGREDQIPQAVPLREDPAFIAILNPNQKKRLTKTEKAPPVQN